MKWVRAKDKTLNLTIRTPVGSLIKATWWGVRRRRWETSHPFTPACFKLQKKRRKKKGAKAEECSVGGGRIKEHGEMRADWERQCERGPTVGHTHERHSYRFHEANINSGGRKRLSRDTWGQRGIWNIIDREHGSNCVCTCVLRVHNSYTQHRTPPTPGLSKENSNILYCSWLKTLGCVPNPFWLRTS